MTRHENSKKACIRRSALKHTGRAKGVVLSPDGVGAAQLGEFALYVLLQAVDDVVRVLARYEAHRDLCHGGLGDNGEACWTKPAFLAQAQVICF